MYFEMQCIIKELFVEISIKRLIEIYKGEIELELPEGNISKGLFLYFSDEDNSNIKPSVALLFAYKGHMRYIVNKSNGSLKDFYTNALKGFKKGRVKLNNNDLVLFKTGEPLAVSKAFKRETMALFGL